MSNVSTKVTVSKEVAEALESAKSIRSEEVIVSMSISKSFVGEQAVLNSVNPFIVAKMLLNGYQVEQTPEEKLREYYNDLYDDASNEDPGTRLYELEAKMAGVVDTLDILGITIEGINA